MSETGLFDGTSKIMGGLSNEKELAASVPCVFKEHRNQWARLASTLFFKGGQISHWKWRAPESKEKQLACLSGLLHSFDIPHEDKIAVAGWMLSEMLREFPGFSCLIVTECE